jgi:hypothetical protein
MSQGILPKQSIKFLHGTAALTITTETPAETFPMNLHRKNKNKIKYIHMSNTCIEILI